MGVAEFDEGHFLEPPRFEPSPVQIARVFRAVAARTGVSREEMVGRSRFERVSGARQLAMYFIYRRARSSYPELARIFGGRNWTTCRAAVLKVERQIGRHGPTAELARRIERDLDAP